VSVEEIKEVINNNNAKNESDDDFEIDKNDKSI
jgi:hypothetical protein